MSSHSIFQFL
uniref:Uncharacterized protein n=1 Tax=Anguilla anguilla TaxID=7936 RepID=A0A0E9TZU5_ANGAN